MIKTVKHKIEILPNKILKNKTLKSDRYYIVDGEVLVFPGISIRAKDKATILLINGLRTNDRLKRSALIFSPGSKLIANKLAIKAANNEYKLDLRADNGGIWFLGAGAQASNAGIRTLKNRKTNPSLYKIHQLTTSYLGKLDTICPKSPRTHSDDIDGISILGVSIDEWDVQNISSLNAGDDGIDITNSHIHLDSLIVKNPNEDCINLSSSRLVIHKNLSLLSPKNGLKDRDLFDFEVDNGASFLELHRGIKIEMHGVFGDQVILSSNQMPQPVTKTNNERTYKFKGRLKKSALIYTIDID